MTNKEKQNWLKDNYPLTIVTDRYSGTYSNGYYLAFPLDFDEIPSAVNDSDPECAEFWEDYLEPVGKGSSVQAAIDDLIYKMHKQTESEDERIRKALIDALKVSETIGELKFRLPYPTREECIAYLEKQKEQKPILKFKVGDKIHLIDGTSPNYEDDCITIREIGTVNYIGEFKEGYVPIKEQNKWELVKEQKPSINIDQLKSLMLQYLQEAANEKDDSDIEADTDKWVRKILGYDFEQKPAEWSEEDESNLQSCIAKIEIDMQHWDKHGKTMVDGDIKLIDWLKSLPERFNLQPKQEWSEDDEEMLNTILSFSPILKGLAECNMILGREGNQVKVIDKCNAWLKSLCPQPHWKPSEEQMNELEKVSIGNACAFNYGILRELYNNLKKL